MSEQPVLRFQASVVARGQRYGVVDGAHFEFQRLDDVNSRWILESPTLPRVEVVEGDSSEVKIDGQLQPTDVLPDSMSLVMGMQGSDAFTVATAERSISRSACPDGSEQLEFDSFAGAHFRLRVGPHGFVTDLQISLEGRVVERAALVNLEATGPSDVSWR